MPDVRTGNAEVDGTPVDAGLVALTLRLGAHDLTPTGSYFALLHAGALIESMPPGEALRMLCLALKVRGAKQEMLWPG